MNNQLAVLPVPDASADPCGGLTPIQLEALRGAARILASSPGLLTRLAAAIGAQGDWISRRTGGLGRRLLGGSWQSRVQALTEKALWRGFGLATLGMPATGTQAPRGFASKAMASLSGAAGGFMGMPGLAVDIPASTLLIMRAIAEIARSHGEDLSEEATRRACLEVFALGGPPSARPGGGQPAGDQAEPAELGYWSTRAALNHATLGTAVQFAARSFGLALSEKLLAQAIPVAGAVAGSALNWLFMDFYQQMARVHFTIRAVEREAADPAAIRACFDRLVAQARGA